MRNIRYGLEQLFRRLSKTVSIFFSIVFFIDFKSKFDFSLDSFRKSAGEY